MKIKLLFFTIVLLLSLNVNAQTWQIFTTTNSSLQDNQVNSITIDENGTIWLATNKGLAAYRNGKWIGYSTENGLSNNRLNSILFNESDISAILIASDSGLNIVNVDSIGFTTPPEYINRTNSGILSDTVLAVDLDGFYNYWIGTDKGLSVITNSGIYNYNEDNGFMNSKVNVVNVLTQDWAHIGTSGGGVSRLKYNGIDGITSASDIITTWSLLASDTVLAIYVTDDTLRWYGTTQGVSTHFGEKTKDGPITDGGSWWIYNTISSGIIDNYVRAITSDYEGNMWFGTRKGLSKLSKTDSFWSSYTESDGLVSNNIFDVKVDSQNNLWVATDKGVSLLSDISTSISDEIIGESYKIKVSNYPNPFNPTTTITFTIPINGQVNITVFDELGRKVNEIVDKYYTIGSHEIFFDATDLASGVYYYRLQVSEFFRVKKLVVLK